MIDPTDADIGRTVIYRGGHPNAEPEEGVITHFNDWSVFVRYGADKGSKGTERCDLKWAHPRPHEMVREDELAEAESAA